MGIPTRFNPLGINDDDGMPKRGLVFYTPLNNNTDTKANTGQALIYSQSKPDVEEIAGVRCLKFTGTSSKFIYTTDVLEFPSGNHEFTISVWTYLDSEQNTNRAAISIGTTRNGQSAIAGVGGQGQSYKFGGWGKDIFTGSQQLYAWHHLLMTYDKNYYRCYLDGELINTTSYQSVNILYGGLYIGNFCNECDFWNGYISTVRMYDRALAQNEIDKLATEIEVIYVITAQDLECSFYQKNETFSIQYNSPKTPSFEIIEGELPSSISFSASTGQFTGKGLTDDDHEYSLKVRVYADGCVPAISNVTIHTYKTARISITGKTFTFYTDGSSNDVFSYSSDETVAFSIDSGSSLPPGITLIGNRFYSDGSTSSDYYEVTVRGTSEHNQAGVTASMCFYIIQNKITIRTSKLYFFVDKGAKTKKIYYQTTHFPVTPVYTVVGDLPSGITFNQSNGEFSSDASQTSDMTSTIQLTVASSTGFSESHTVNIDIVIKMQYTAPQQGLALYFPLSSNYTTDEQGREYTYNSGTSSPVATVVQGINCIEIMDGYLESMTQGSIPTGHASFTMSTWAKYNNPSPTKGSPLLFGKDVRYGAPHFTRDSFNRWKYGFFGNDASAGVTDFEWHNFAMTYNADDDSHLCYLDGELILTRITNNLNIQWNSIKIEPYGHVAAARIYDRCLDYDEVSTLYDEFTPDNQIKFYDQFVNFNNETGAKTKTLTFTAPYSGYSFSIVSGSLPTGVTFNSSTGVFTYDGTTITEDDEIDLTITCSGDRMKPATATVTLSMRLTQAYDSLVYMPCNAYKPAAATGQDVVYTGTSASDFTTYKGIPCYCTKQGTYARINEPTMNLGGDKPRSYSVWLAMTTSSVTHQRGIAIGSWNSIWTHPEIASPLNRENSYELGMGGYYGDYGTGVSVSQGEWYHYALTYSSTGEMKLYLNGALVSTKNPHLYNIDDTVLSLGAPPTNSTSINYFPGYIAGARLYNRELTQEEVTELSNEFTPIKPIKFYDQFINFNNVTGAKTKTLTFIAPYSGYSFNIVSGTLPAGVTFNSSTGVFTYDGTTIIEDEEIDLTITCSGSYMETATATVTLSMRLTQAYDSLVYMPCNAYKPAAATGQDVVYSGTSLSSFTTYKGIPCYSTNTATFARITETTINQGADKPRSYSVWLVMTTNSTGYQRGIAIGQFANSHELCSPNNNGNTYEICAGGHSNDIRTGVIVNPGEWHHYVQTYSDSGELKLYLDGSLISTTTGKSIDINNTIMSLGAPTDSASYKFTGYVAGARLYNRVLSQEEVTELSNEFTPVKPIEFVDQFVNFNNEAGATNRALLFTAPYSGYSFEIIDGTLPTRVAFDSSTGVFTYDGTTITEEEDIELTITCSGAFMEPATATVTLNMRLDNSYDSLVYTSLSSYVDTAKTGQAIAYTGTSASDFTTYQGIPCYYTKSGTYARITEPTINQGADKPRSYSVWLVMTCNNQFQTGLAIGSWSSTSNHTELRSPHNYRYSYEICAGGYYFDLRTGVTVNPGEWHHYVQTYSADGTLKLYLDGKLIKTETNTTSNIDSTIMSIGAPTGTDADAFIGYAAAARLYNETLSQAAVIGLYKEFEPSL